MDNKPKDVEYDWTKLIANQQNNTSKDTDDSSMITSCNECTTLIGRENFTKDKKRKEKPWFQILLNRRYLSNNVGDNLNQ